MGKHYFLDEKCFVVDKKNAKRRCFRRRNERFHHQYIYQYGTRRSIIEWATISSDGIIRFNGNVTSRRSIHEALQSAMMPYINGHNRQMSLMHDNAPGQTAGATRDSLAANNIQVFGPWPSKSPDMNPIEHLWAQLENALQRRPNRPMNEEQLWQAVQEEWENVNMWDVRRLIFSMRRRCTALVEAGGGHTKY